MSEAIKKIDEICAGNRSSNRAKILEYEEFAKKHTQIEIPVTHRIHGGMYMREITIPKDCLITGQIYKFNHFDVMISGDITVSTDTGERKRFKGYNVFNGMHGKKRAGYAHEDTTWITIHPFTGADGEEIQKKITAESFEELREFELMSHRLDFDIMLKQIGFTHDEVKKISDIDSDMTELPENFNNAVYVGKSDISGNGLFSKKDFLPGELICPARINDKRTIAGRYTNHGFQVNAKMVINESDINLVAVDNIFKGEEITVNYREVIAERIKEGDI